MLPILDDMAGLIVSNSMCSRLVSSRTAGMLAMWGMGEGAGDNIGGEENSV